ncbi:MAG: transcription-repair coupling factor [bacterium]
MNWESTLSLLGKRFSDAFKHTPFLSVPGIPQSAEATVVLALANELRRTILWVAEGERALETNHGNLLALCADRAAVDRILYYPAWESLPQPAGAEDPETCGERLGVSFRLLEADSPLVVVTCVQAIMQRTIPPDRLRAESLSAALGDEVELDDAADRLGKLRYKFCAEVTARGHASKRGGILDIWPITDDWPVRLEFEGPVLVSARTFDPATQRSLGQVKSVRLTPVGEWSALSAGDAAGSGIGAYLPGDAVLVWSDPRGVEAHALAYQEMLSETGNTGVSLPFNTARDQLAGKASSQVSLGEEEDGVHARFAADFMPVAGALTAHNEVIEPDMTDGARRRFLAELKERAGRGQMVRLFFDTKGSLDRYIELHQGDFPADGFVLEIGAVSDGFTSEELALAVVSEKELFGHRKTTRGPYDPHAAADRTAPQVGARISDATDLHAGDMVVHIQHGIGKYIGLQKILFDGQLQEVVTLEYADGVLLHVPLSQAHLLSLYVGVTGHGAHLHKLGGTRWRKEKEGALEAIEDFASSLLEVQAARQVLEGHAFPPDMPWQHEFEAAFPYRETPDQEQAIKDVKLDMESRRPMDRLVCGDVGFGKTEVAIRAAFKAVMGGRQVVVLVPTTVLCQQHYQTFCQRMAAYPVRVAMLSRLCPPAQRRQIVADLRAGSVDIVIGTHSLLQPGIAFANLGLVIIDEEQRFGVRHKEMLKHMRRMVDILTMTATPIPRTLYMGLTGAKDLSVVQTPPERRLPVTTIVTEGSDAVVRNAIMRELSRDGQVYYLHNRVMTIERVREHLCRLVPEARIAVAHGQMCPGELAGVMTRFIAGEHDVLLCTVIIESGLDIPNVNTILIDRADRFGLAELYQLRGRVGRSIRKGYAYLLLPGHARIDPSARRRVHLLRKHSRLGAGYSLALRDLEIRGSGNILGTEQSGHIAEIGFLLYCQFLRRTVARMKGEAVPPVVDVQLKLDFISLSPDEAGAGNSAVVSAAYVPDEQQRINTYRDIAGAGTADEIAGLKTAMRDRYGPIPPCVERLLALASLRVAAAGKNITSIETRDDRIMLIRAGQYIMDGSRHARMRARTVDGRIADIARCVAAL